jgi:hypothetical protein
MSEQVDEALPFDRYQGQFSIDRQHDAVLRINYTLSDERMNEAIDAGAIGLGEIKPFQLMRFIPEKDLLAIIPRNTLPRPGDFLGAKYSKIISIVLEGFEIDAPDQPDDVYTILEQLPTGLIRNPDFGLGILKEFRFIVDAIEEVEGIRHLLINRRRQTELRQDSYVLSLKDFDALRRAIARTHEHALKRARADKIILAHNKLLTQVAPERFPERRSPYTKDVIFKTVPADAPNLSDRDQMAVVELIKQNKQKIAKRHPRDLLELQRDIELVTLEQLVSKTEGLINGNHAEGVWQRYFTDNPFLLSLAFGLPIVAIGGQVSVGGRTFSGRRDKVADFLHRNNLTDNLALIEIKTAKTPLLGTSYRSGVYPPSRELSGSITHLLDQRYHLQTEIAMLRHNNGRSELESYAIKGVVIAGTMPTNQAEKKSLELFRNSLNDLLVITFDELLGKLRGLHAFLDPPNKLALLKAPTLPL